MVRLGLGHEGGEEDWRGKKEEVGVGVTGREGGRRQRQWLQDLEASMGHEWHRVTYVAT